MFTALVIIPAFVTIPDRTEEKLVHPAPLIHIGTCISVHIGCKLLYNDKVNEGLLIQIFAPAVLRMFEIIAIKDIFKLPYEIRNVSVAYCGVIVLFIIFRIFVGHLDILDRREPIAFMYICFDDIATSNSDRVRNVVSLDLVNGNTAFRFLNLVTHLIYAEIFTIAVFPFSCRAVSVPSGNVNIHILGCRSEKYCIRIVIII